MSEMWGLCVPNVCITDKNVMCCRSFETTKNVSDGEMKFGRSVSTANVG